MRKLRTPTLAAALIASVAATSAGQAQSVFLSSSDTDPFASQPLSLDVGQQGTLFVWVDPTGVNTINGIGLDVISSEIDVLEGISFEIENPSITFPPPFNLTVERWTGTGAGELGDLVLGSNSALASTTSVGDSLGSLGTGDPGNVNGNYLHASLVFAATAEGVTVVTPQVNALGISNVTEGLINDSFSFEGVTVSVVPEPTTAALLGFAGACLTLRRRRVSRG